MQYKATLLSLTAIVGLIVPALTYSLHGSGLTFAGVDFPNTPSVNATYEFITEYLDGPTLNHVTRSAVFALMVHSKAAKNEISNLPLSRLDAEALVVAALLHDMSWNVYRPETAEFVTQERRFEVDGAFTAREFLSNITDSGEVEPPWDERRLQLVWDAIALHTTMSVAQYKQLEVGLTNYGIFIDLNGIPNEPFPSVPVDLAVTQDEYDQVYAEIPALNLTSYVKNLTCGLNIRKPATTYDNVVSSYGVAFLEGYTTAGHTAADALIARAEREGIPNFTDKVPDPNSGNRTT